MEVTCLFSGMLNNYTPRMLRFLGVRSLLFFSLAASLVAQTPSSAKPSPSKADYSQEGFVIEQSSRKERFENDGTSSQEDTARVRTQSDAGVQSYGFVSFSHSG